MHIRVVKGRIQRLRLHQADIVEQIFRQDISMGKGMGLMSMVQAVAALARAASNP